MRAGKGSSGERFRKIRIVLGVILLLAGLAVFLYPNFRNWSMDQTVREVAEQFQEVSQDVSQTETPADPASSQESGDTDDFGLLREQMGEYNARLLAEGQLLADAWTCEQKPVELSALTDGEAVGYIEIPDMEVTLPLYIGTSSKNLANGAAVLSETSMPIGGTDTNCVIAGHRGYRGSPYFREIEKLNIGSMVYITNPWETLSYTVVSTDIVYPSDSESIKIQKGKDMVTLVTCHPYMSGGKYRYLVFCERVTTGDKSAVISDPVNGNEEKQADGMESFMEFEDGIRIILPVMTLIIAGIILLLRTKSNKKSKKEGNKL